MEEQQHVYEQYSPYKDVKGVRKFFNYLFIVTSKNTYRNE